MSKKIKVIIADDHDIYLDGLERILSNTEEIEVIGTAPDGAKLVELVKQRQPDVVITDIRMPVLSGVEAISAIGEISKNIRILVLSTFDNNYLIVDALEAGALGYVTKDAPKTEVVAAIQEVFNGIPHYCSRTTASLARLIKKSRFNPYSETKAELFTQFEKKIIYYICEEKTSEEIGVLLNIGKRSIEGYRRKILSRMNVKTSTGVAIYAVKNKLYPLPDQLLNG